MNETNKTQYFTPTSKQEKDRSRVYDHLQQMIDLKAKNMPHFQSGPDGQRSWNTYIDDSERILNGYTLSREDQGKEDWQSNLLDNISLAKLTAIAAGVGLKVPDMTFRAVNKDGIYSAKRAELFKSITKQSYTQDNPTLNSFREVWHMMSHGVVFEYEGYKTGGAYQNVITSFDTLTGAVNTERRYRTMNGKPFSTILNPNEFFWWTFFVRDIQEQPRLAWVQHYNKAELELEFSKYPNYKFVKDKTEATRLLGMQVNTLYMQKWQGRVNDTDDYEVLRMYSKVDDNSEDAYGYEIWVNGVPLLQCPLLWGDKEKKYPFVKEISKPFANTNFFVGMTLPAILESYQDGKNTILNSLIDKLYRGLNPLKLVGLQNKDLLDVEASIITEDDTVYVPDINAVKFMDHPGINAGELQMLAAMDRGIESMSVDRSQQGMASPQNKTASQAVIEDNRARELKGILYMFLENLWIQKTYIRTEIILSHYLKDKAAQESIKGKIISIKDYTFGDSSRGILDIYVAKSKSDRLSSIDIEAREKAMEDQGIAYKLVSMDVDYLDEWEYDIEIVPTAFYNTDNKAKQDELMSEIQQVTTLFPEFFVANKDKYLEDVLESHGKHLDEYSEPQEQLPQNIQQGPPQENTPAAPETALSAGLKEGAQYLGTPAA